jgi:rhodanese-related sulfurtransferase
MTQAQTYRSIGIAEARVLIGRGDALVLDIRDADSFRRGHIEGAEHAGAEDIARYLSITPKDRPVVVCCYSGESSRTCARTFADSGFSQAFSLEGGYAAWEAALRPAPSASFAPSERLRAFLAEHGFDAGDINAPDKSRATPLMVAARLAPPELVSELLQAGADIGAVNADGNQALWLACVGEAVENIRLLAEAGIEVQHVNFTGATPLMFAASSGRAKAVAALLAVGADPTLETDLGLSALDMASTRECLDLMRAAARKNKAH